MASIPAPGAELPESLTGRTGYRLMILGERLKIFAVDTLAPLGVRPRHFNVLAALATATTPSQQDLSRLLGIDPNVMVTLIDDLEQFGLAQRQPNPRDRRRHAIVLTATGRRVLAEGAARLDAAESAVFGQLTVDELEVLHGVAGRLLAAPWSGTAAAVPDQGAARRSGPATAAARGPG